MVIITRDRDNGYPVCYIFFRTYYSHLGRKKKKYTYRASLVLRCLPSFLSLAVRKVGKGLAGIFYHLSDVGGVERR